MKILALSGSLRGASVNSALLRAASRVAPPSYTIALFMRLGALPLFNPDLEGAPPAPVLELRAAVDRADALMIASPEYAHGISGTMKNALDWLVSHEGFVAKPVALINTSPRAHHAYQALVETLTTMSANIIREACFVVPLLGSGLGEEGMADDPAIAAAIRRALQDLERAVKQGTAPGPNFPV